MYPHTCLVIFLYLTLYIPYCYILATYHNQHYKLVPMSIGKDKFYCTIYFCTEICYIYIRQFICILLEYWCITDDVCKFLYSYQSKERKKGDFNTISVCIRLSLTASFINTVNAPLTPWNKQNILFISYCVENIAMFLIFILHLLKNPFTK